MNPVEPCEFVCVPVCSQARVASQTRAARSESEASMDGAIDDDGSAQAQAATVLSVRTYRNADGNIS